MRNMPQIREYSCFLSFISMRGFGDTFSCFFGDIFFVIFFSVFFFGFFSCITCTGIFCDQIIELVP